ncbi:MAG: hypothetical protein HC801_10265, partial [Nitrospira sp.]|nr:hypothetical protein [Nitrospira sp.]
MENNNLLSTLPILPVKRTVLFPGVMMPLTIGRERSIAAVNAAMKTEDKMIVVVAQRDPQTEEPGLSDLYSIGTKSNYQATGPVDRRNGSRSRPGIGPSRGPERRTVH